MATSNTIRKHSATDSFKAVTNLLAVQASQTPNHIAVIQQDKTLTYAALNSRVNQLAHHLLAHGVGPNIIVGLCLNRSPEMIVALMAILKAGGVYLPLDPAYPAKRLALMINDAGAPLIITDSTTAPDLPAGSHQLTLIDSDASTILKRPLTSPATQSAPDDLAYIIYTSGSTGKPKGVMVSHKALVNHMAWRQQAYPLSGNDRILQKASPSFDISIWEIFAPLLAGGQLILPKPGGERDIAHLTNLIRDSLVTIVHFSPSLWQIVLDQPAVSEWTHVRHAFSGGEPLTGALARKIYQKIPQVELHNQYGPTEATIDVTVFDCNPHQQDEMVPIGKPIQNTSIYILDEHGNPVPTGETGTLFIGGDCLAQGYLNRPELTAEKFKPDPFSEQTGARMYNSGDLARRRPDGNIEFLGRADHQVKIRGYRIELGEIEAALRHYPGIRTATVATSNEAGPETHLVAYLISTQTPPPTVDDLQAYLGKTLPAYMIPSFFIFLDEMPLTPNGKIDRKALPKLEPTRNLAATYVAPRTEMEQLMADILTQLLPVDRVGVHDNFFSLGGSSLTGTQFISRLLLAYPLPLALSVRHLFDTPTIAGLSAKLEDLLLNALESLTEEEAATLLDSQTLA